MAAAAVVSVSMGVMKPVLDKLTTLMGDEYMKIKGLRKAVTFLQRELGEMEALLEKVDSADQLDPQAKKWRRDIIEMSYNIEDRIDDFMHSIGEANDKIGFLRKAAKYLRTFKDRRRLANEFQEIKTLVTEASDRRKRYMFDQCISITNLVVVDPRVSALYKESASLVGIESQKDKLVNWAIDEVKQLKFLAIVGFGGIGKTTLAKEVYHEVGGKLECKAFISVSQKPQIMGLFNSLLSQLGLRTYSHACQLEDPINDLRRYLHDKRYFIVVDDLWEMEAWDAIQYAFPQNNYGSRVMITTRDDKVAKRCCGTSGIIHNMKPLSEPDSRKLFFNRIFESQDDCPSGLEAVSRAILKRCGGLPLAIITIAGILASQQTKLKEAWEYIQTALAPEPESNIDYEKMMYILDLSYKHLPLHLKACFLYLGTYPEDHKIERVELVRRWVAEGFVSNSAGLNVWDVAESYFNELVNRSMIQPSFESQNVILSCRVHDMMLDLILRRCTEDNFLILVNDPHELAAVKDKVIRRLTMDLKDVDDDRLAMTNLSHLRSLTILFREGSKWKPPWTEFKFMRVLFLSFGSMTIKMDLFGIINQLPHLRYLRVEGGEVFSNTMLTTQIKGLRLLETLDLSRLHVQGDCHFVLDFVDLPRLSHLSVSATSGIALPHGIEEMKQLRTLLGWDLGHSSLQSIGGLGELKALSELYLIFGGRCKHGEAKPEWMSSLSTSLEKLDKLRSLNVTASYADVAHCADGNMSLFSRSEGSLERLHLWFWTFSIFPRWIEHLRSLKVLRLGVKQIVQENIGVLGILPSLIDLRLRIVEVPTTRIVIGENLFKAVKGFTFNCDGISSLAFEAGAMPNLAELTLQFNTADWDRVTATAMGLHHLKGLQKINVHNSKAESARINAVLMRIIYEHPARPTPTYTYHQTLKRLKEYDPSECA